MLSGPINTDADPHFTYFAGSENLLHISQRTNVLGGHLIIWNAVELSPAVI